MSYELTGAAEGIIDGRRQTMPLDIRKLSQTGMYAVRWQKPARGTWMLVITSSQAGSHAATALVTIDSRGAVAGVTCRPIRSRMEGGWCRGVSRLPRSTPCSRPTQPLWSRAEN